MNRQMKKWTNSIMDRHGSWRCNSYLDDKILLIKINLVKWVLSEKFPRYCVGETEVIYNSNVAIYLALSIHHSLSFSNGVSIELALLFAVIFDKYKSGINKFSSSTCSN